jgi:hypothetical protein
MSAPVTNTPAPQSMSRRRVVEIQERRRCSAVSAHGNIRARGTVKHAAVAASLAEWGL